MLSFLKQDALRTTTLLSMSTSVLIAIFYDSNQPLIWFLFGFLALFAPLAVCVAMVLRPKPFSAQMKSLLQGVGLGMALSASVLMLCFASEEKVTLIQALFFALVLSVSVHAFMLIVLGAPFFFLGALINFFQKKDTGAPVE